MTEKTETLVIRISPETKEVLRNLADFYRRTMTDQVIWMIEQEAKAQLVKSAPEPEAA